MPAKLKHIHLIHVNYAKRRQPFALVRRTVLLVSRLKKKIIEKIGEPPGAGAGARVGVAG